MKKTKAIVVGTGRCGSNSLCAWLKTTNLRPMMEPNAHNLVVEQRRFLEGTRNSFPPWNRYSVATSLPSSESPLDVVVDNNLSLFILPAWDLSLKIVWLIRNAWDCVGSLLHWKWYRQPDDIQPDDVFAKNRLEAPWSGEMTRGEWKELSQLGRCAWCWSFINRSIEYQLRYVPLDQWTIVRLEDWCDGEAKRLCEFLECTRPADLSLPRLNSGSWCKPGEIPIPKPKWTEDEKALVWRFVGGMMEKHYPSWLSPEQGA